MIAIPFKTLQQIDAALPNMKELRRSLSDTAKHMGPLLNLARQNEEIEKANRNYFNLDVPR